MAETLPGMQRALCGLIRICGRLFKLLDRLLILQELVGRNHGDAVPRTNLVAQRATDAAGKVDGADLKGGLVAMPGNDVDAVHRAHDQARFAAGAPGLVEQSQCLGELRLGHPQGIVGGPRA